MCGCRVDRSTEDFTAQHPTGRVSAKRCKPFEVSCLVAGGTGCGGGRRSAGVFVILLAVGSTGGAAVRGHEWSLLPFSHRPSARRGTNICRHKAQKNEFVAFFGSMKTFFYVGNVHSNRLWCCRSMLTALLVVLFGLFICITAARVHRRAAPGIRLCTAQNQQENRVNKA